MPTRHGGTRPLSGDASLPWETLSPPAAPTLPVRSPDAPSWGDPRRWLVFWAGFALLIWGIGLTVTAGLGVGSWQVFETGLVTSTGLSFGPVILLESIVAIALAWVWLGQRPWLATGLLAFGGVGINAVLAVLRTPEALLGQLAFLVAGTVLIAIGVAFYLAAELGASAQDSLFVGFYRRYDVRPGAVRLGLDAILVLAGTILGGQLGVGTVLMTVGIPVLIEPALLLGHRLAGTPPPDALQRDQRPAEDPAPGHAG